MPDVGIRDLCDNLSRYIHEVRDEKGDTVTDHGQAVARIVPLINRVASTGSSNEA